MNITIKERTKKFDNFNDNINFNLLKKQKELGKGEQGKVYSYNYCDREQKNCMVVKKIYIQSEQSKYLKDPFGKRSLLHSTFIELASIKLVNQIILSNICPNFILNYTWQSKSRSGICDDIYPDIIYFINEYLNDSQTFTEWIKNNLSQENLFNAYFQIIYAIYTLKLRLNMTHLDLHADNIIVQQIPKGGYWEYTINDQTYYVPNLGYIFYINDFGHAWIPNVLKSWFIRKRYKPKSIKHHFDLMILYRSHLSHIEIPKTFQKVLQSIIKDLRNSHLNKFPDIIKKYFSNLYEKPKNNDVILDSYNIHNHIDISKVPTELQNLID